MAAVGHFCFANRASCALSRGAISRLQWRDSPISQGVDVIDRFTKLKEQTQELGNHHRKYLHFISVHKDKLVEQLDAQGKIDQVHLWSAAPDVHAEMQVVCGVGRDHDEKLAFLGCFFALQLLNMNTRAVNVLRLGLASPESRYRVYREFMLQMGRDLRTLSAS